MEDRDSDEHNGCPLHLQSDISHALASKQSVLSLKSLQHDASWIKPYHCYVFIKELTDVLHQI